MGNAHELRPPTVGERGTAGPRLALLDAPTGRRRGLRVDGSPQFRGGDVALAPQCPARGEVPDAAGLNENVENISEPVHGLADVRIPLGRHRFRVGSGFGEGSPPMGPQLHPVERAGPSGCPATALAISPPASAAARANSTSRFASCAGASRWGQCPKKVTQASSDGHGACSGAPACARRTTSRGGPVGCWWWTTTIIAI